MDVESSAVEEKWNWITHAIGIVLSIIGGWILIIENTQKTQYSSVAILIYSVSLFILYLASTLYHYYDNLEVKKKLRIFDHVSIYILIAGTYTPVSLISLLSSKGCLLFIIVWSITFAGTILKLFFTGKFETVSLILYLVMGWLIMIDIDSLINVVGNDGILHLILGGAAYTSGIIFYVFKKLKFNHVIWHVFVLAGSFFHYIFILKYVI